MSATLVVFWYFVTLDITLMAHMIPGLGVFWHFVEQAYGGGFLGLSST